MTTTKVKTRKSDQLSLPGPEELFLYNSSAKNIWMEGKALYFLEQETQANSRGSSEAFFWSKQKWWKVWISAVSKPRPSIAGQTSYTGWNHSHQSGREQMLIRYRENYPRKGYFFCYFTLFYCIFPRQDGRSRSACFRTLETSLSMYLWISFEYMFVVVQFYSWFRFYYPFLRDRNVW